MENEQNIVTSTLSDDEFYDTLNSIDLDESTDSTEPIDEVTETSTEVNTKRPTTKTSRRSKIRKT